MPEIEKPIHPRKLEIVNAAVTCFLERGYHQTGMREIAKQADVSLGNLYNHFKGKEALLVFIAEIEGEELSAFIDRLSGNIEPLVKIERFIQEYASYVAKPENALLGVEILAEALRNPAIANVFGRNRELLIARLSGCLTEGAETGIFAPQIDSRSAACLILDALEGQGLRCLSLPAGCDHSMKAISAFILGGLTS